MQPLASKRSGAAPGVPVSWALTGTAFGGNTRQHYQEASSGAWGSSELGAHWNSARWPQFGWEGEREGVGLAPPRSQGSPVPCTLYPVPLYPVPSTMLW